MILVPNRLNKKSAVTDTKDFFQVKIIDGETLFACNICNEGVQDEHSIKRHIYDKHKYLTLDILKSDEYTDAEEVKCVKVIHNSTGPYNSASLHCLGILKYLLHQIISNSKNI